jgi:mono/diheme cytochrome c family protein
MTMRIFSMGVALPRGLAGAGIALAWIACAAHAEPAADEPTDFSLAEIGQPYFASYCASCHGISARGNGPAAGSLRLPPADLTRIAARRGGRFPAGEIAQFIDGRFQLESHGSREMPVWGTVFTSGIPEADVAESISRGKVAVLVEYLKSIQVPAQAAKPSPAP